MKKIFWIGPVVHTENDLSSNAMSPAANKWQLEFIDALLDNRYSVTCLSYIPFQTWPFGKIWVKYPDDSKQIKRFNIISAEYINLLFIRELWIVFSILFKLKINKNFTKIDYIFTYNPLLRHRLLANLLKLFRNYKWISIVADDIAKGSPDITVFLSYGYYQRFDKKNKYFLDGGIHSINKTLDLINKEKTKILLYAGAISKWTGIIEFTNIFQDVFEEFNVELHIYGKGNSKEIETIAKRNARIKFFGFVSDEELHIACKKAFAFINPRPVNISLGENNFPSKLLMYLSYIKPILTTKTQGISPDYDNILNYYHDTDTLRYYINKYISDDIYYKSQCENILSYVNENSWNKKIKIFLEKIEK